ncbi:hypothetical protein FACS1894219_07190 [Clostridia bacterium]|nr:hypothetical protein FACS1894219_07190 [Clostridia bacterium]
MKLTYYGTAAAEGWPAPFCSCDHCERARLAGGRNIRTRSQALIDDSLLIDFPADTYHHVLTYGLDLRRVRNIIFTHAHEDHLYPEDLWITTPPYAYDTKHEVIPVIHAWGNERVYERRQTRSDRVIFHVINPFEALTLDQYTVTPLLADHAKNQTCLIYLIESDGKSVLYANDTGYFPDATWDYLSNRASNGLKLNFASLDTTCGTETGARRNHMGYACGIEVKERLINMGVADTNTGFCFHHFSHNGG